MTSHLCIGGAQIGMPYGIANTTGQPDCQQIASMVRTAVKNDIWYFDTGQSYGQSEQRLGEVFAQQGINERVKCITKLHPEIGSHDGAEVLHSVRGSLERLQVPRLWALLAHRPGQTDDAALRSAVRRAKEENLIRFWGASVYHPGEAMALLKDRAVDIIQVPFNILDRRLIDNGFFEAARRIGKKVMIRSVFLQGLVFLSLDDLPARGMEWAAAALSDFHNRIEALNTPLVHFALKALTDVARDALIVIGAETAGQLKENINSFRAPAIRRRLLNIWWQELPVYPQRLLDPSKW